MSVSSRLAGSLVAVAAEASLKFSGLYLSQVKVFKNKVLICAVDAHEYH